jgi:hypothetical protein
MVLTVIVHVKLLLWLTWHPNPANIIDFCVFYAAAQLKEATLNGVGLEGEAKKEFNEIKQVRPTPLSWL